MMEVTNELESAAMILTSLGVLAVTLRGDFTLAKACADALHDYVTHLPCGPNQAPMMVYYGDEWRFDVVDMWDDDGSVM
jgi:hypothetical protein